MVPLEVFPFSTIDAPMIGSLFESKTCPFMVKPCAIISGGANTSKRVSRQNFHQIDNLSFIVINSLLLHKV